MATKRLIKELDAYHRDPSPALRELQPVSDDDLFNWNAVLRGPEGTAYEGIYRTTFQNMCTASILIHSRWSLHPLNLYPLQLPILTAQYPLSNTLLPPKRQLQDRRDLLGPFQRIMDAGLWLGKRP